MQFQVNAHLFYNTAEFPFIYFASRHIIKRYLGLESKSLGGCIVGLGHLALALIALVFALEFAA